MKRKASEEGASEAKRMKPTGFPPLKNDLILRAARGEKVERIPIWAFRQAGRYLPEYRAVSLEHGFFTVCRTPELACKVTLQPIDRFPLDASIIFSDILVIPQAMGMEVQMIKGKGPHFPNPLVVPEDMARINMTPDVNTELGYVFEAVTLTRHRLEGRVPLIGFAGAPWTLMAYMIEGGGSKTFSKAKAWLYKYPDAAHTLLEGIAELLIDYLVGKVRAGAQLLCVFDSWAGILSPDCFRKFALPVLATIATSVKQRLGPDAVPMIVFAKGAFFAFDWLTETDYDVISLDWNDEAEEVAKQVQGKVALQGNLDPCALYAPLKDIRTEVGRMMSRFPTRGYIANLGHGMYPDMNPEALATFIDAVHSFDLTKRPIRVGTRDSHLAMIQTHWVMDKLHAAFPTRRFEIVKSATLGDKDLSVAIKDLGADGVFTKELEVALLADAVDLVVHSLKDMPTKCPSGLEIAAICERMSPRDAVVFNRKHTREGVAFTLAGLPEGSVIGSSSVRRIAQLTRAHPALKFETIRGNVKTRLRKLDDAGSPYDAIILAEAGLQRMNLHRRIGQLLDGDDMFYAVGQGALGIEIRTDDSEVRELVTSSLADASATFACLAERALLKQLRGGCKSPVAVKTVMDGQSITLHASVLSLDGSKKVTDHITQNVTNNEEAEALGVAVAENMLKNGAEEILSAIGGKQRDHTGGTAST